MSYIDPTPPISSSSHLIKFTGGGVSGTSLWKVTESSNYTLRAEEAPGTGYIWKVMDPLPDFVKRVEITTRPLENPQDPHLIGGASHEKVFNFHLEMTPTTCEKSISLFYMRPWELAPAQTWNIILDCAKKDL